MAGVSSMQSLPQDIKDHINTWWGQGISVDAVTEHLEAIGMPRSRSAVGRQRKEWAEIIKDTRESRIRAEVLVSALKDAPASEMAQANIELAHVLMQRFLRAEMEGEGVTLKANELMFLTKAINNLTNARKAEVDTAITAENAIQESAQDAEGAGGVLEIRFVDPEPRAEDGAETKQETSLADGVSGDSRIERQGRAQGALFPEHQSRPQERKNDEA